MSAQSHAVRRNTPLPHIIRNYCLAEHKRSPSQHAHVTTSAQCCPLKPNKRLRQAYTHLCNKTTPCLPFAHSNSRPDPVALPNAAQVTTPWTRPALRQPAVATCAPFVNLVEVKTNEYAHRHAETATFHSFSGPGDVFATLLPVSRIFRLL